MRAKLVKDSDREQFIANVVAIAKLRNSRVAQWLIVVFIYSSAAVMVPYLLPNMPASWRTVGLEGHPRLSIAGWWFVLVSEPIYEFVFYHFLYRVGLWWMLLWKTSRLDLHVDGAHPDSAGGLGFLGLTLRSFQGAAFAISTSFAGGLATIVLLTHARVSNYRWEITAVVLITTALFAGPLCFFYGLLVKAKGRGTLDYWTLWQMQQRQFDRKWMQSPSEQADMLGVPDFSEATDLSQILERVRQIRLIPFGWKQLQPLILAALLPFLVVLTLEFPIEQIVRQVMAMAFKF